MMHNATTGGSVSTRRGFSILELVAAVAVLALLGVMIAQVSGAIQATTRASNRIVDAAAQARLAYDRMGLDFDGLLKRQDADFIAANFSNSAAARAADLLQMLSAVRSQDRAGLANRGISILGYRVAPHYSNGDKPCLLRGAKSVAWTEVAMGLDGDGYPPKLIPNGVLPVIPAALQLAYDSAVSSDYDVLAPGVIRAVVGFQLYPFDNSARLMDGANITKTRGQIVYQPPVWDTTPPDNQYVDLSGVSSIVVGLVVVDLNSLRSVDASQVEALADQFVIPSADTLPVSQWMADTENLGKLPQTIPLPARQGVRVYQRAFQIVPYGSPLL